VFDLVGGPERGALDGWMAEVLREEDINIRQDLDDISHGRRPNHLIVAAAAAMKEGGGAGGWKTRLQVLRLETRLWKDGILHKFWTKVAPPAPRTPQWLLAKKLVTEAQLSGAILHDVHMGVKQALDDVARELKHGALGRVDENFVKTCIESAGVYAKRNHLSMRQVGLRSDEYEASLLAEGAQAAERLAAKGISEMRAWHNLPNPAEAAMHQLATAFETQAAQAGIKKGVENFNRGMPLAECLDIAENLAQHTLAISYRDMGKTIGKAELDRVAAVARSFAEKAIEGKRCTEA
jgi:hypothetical protein